MPDAVAGGWVEQPQQRARAHFVSVWERTCADWRAGALVPAPMQAGTTIPTDYCLSTVVRLVDQSPDLSAAVGACQEQVRAIIGAEQFVYPAHSLHITLLGCTPRYPEPTAIAPERVARIRAVCRAVCAEQGSVRMTVRGVNAIGNQLFLQVFPCTDEWAHLRGALDAALLAVGETPLAYADKHPIHLNIARITTSLPLSIEATLRQLEVLRDTEIGVLSVSRIALILTDFVLSRTHVSDVDLLTLR